MHAGVGKVNAGMLRALEQPLLGGRSKAGLSVFAELVWQLGQFVGQKQLFVCGHSLGGALAQLFVQLLWARCVTCG